MNDNVPVVSQRTITIVDFAVTSAYGGGGSALDYSDPSRFAQMTNLTSDDDVWYQIDGGAWTQLLQANAIQFAIDFSTQTLTLKLGEHTDGSVEMRIKIFGVPSGLYADENDVSTLPDDAVGALVNDGAGNLSWGAVPDGVVSGATGQVAIFDGANALTGTFFLTLDSGSLTVSSPGAENGDPSVAGAALINGTTSAGSTVICAVGTIDSTDGVAGMSVANGVSGGMFVNAANQVYIGSAYATPQAVAEIADFGTGTLPTLLLNGAATRPSLKTLGSYALIQNSSDADDSVLSSVRLGDTNTATTQGYAGIALETMADAAPNLMLFAGTSGNVPGGAPDFKSLRILGDGRVLVGGEPVAASNAVLENAVPFNVAAASNAVANFANIGAISSGAWASFIGTDDAGNPIKATIGVQGREGDGVATLMLGVDGQIDAGLAVSIDAINGTRFYAADHDTVVANIGINGSYKSTPVALATLGSAATAGAGTRAFITDGLTLGSWGGVAVDGGIVVKPVWSNGVAWLNG